MSDILKGDDFTVFTENWNHLQQVNTNVKSRYGRIQKPKLSDDFINYDPEVDGNKGEPKLEKNKTNNSSNPRTQILQETYTQCNGNANTLTPKNGTCNVTADSIIEEFDDDYESPIAINKRKFFKSPNKHFKSQYIHDNYSKNRKKENGNNTPVNMTDVLKIVTSKSPENFEEGKKSPKKPLKTYTNKKKSTENFILETFGLPDDPLLPFTSNHLTIDDIGMEDDEKLLIKKWCDMSEGQLQNNTKDTEIENIECVNVTGKSDGEMNNSNINETHDVNIRSDIEETDELHNSEGKVVTHSNEDKTNFEIGDLAWARIGSMPFWPCFCDKDPDNNLFMQKIGKIKQGSVHHHVRFFGDNGRRAWIDIRRMLHFRGRDDLNTITQPKKFRLNSRWINAVDEAESMLSKTVPERRKFFDEIFIQKKMIKYEKAAQKKVEKATSTDITENNNVKEVNKLEEDDVKKRTKEMINSTPESSRPKRLRKSLYNKNETSIVEMELDNLKNTTKSPTCTLDNIETLYKRSTLYKGISKERVCQICTEKSNVLKCHVCLGTYHIKCQENSLRMCTKKTSLSMGLVEIINIKTKQSGNYPLDITSDLNDMNLNEKIDMKMKEIMCEFNDKSIIYADSTTDSSGCEEIIKSKRIEVNDYGVHAEETNLFKCYYCSTGLEPPCSICLQYISKRQSKILQKCSMTRCRKYYHAECLKTRPQTQWSVINRLHKDSNEYLDTFVCPSHLCHTCFADPSEKKNNRLAHCIKCSGVYHTSNYCLPAGTQILSTNQIICPRHADQSKRTSTINTNWCFICSKGGNLICCETCPTSVHTECMQVDISDDDSFICEDCESGRFPLYNEVVWVKLGSYRWWPARTIFPNEIPDNVMNHTHEKYDFVVQFFGTNDYNWIGRGRVFLFDEDDYNESFTARSKMDVDYRKALEEATTYYKINKEFRDMQFDLFKSTLKPPPYIRIKVNRPYGNVKLFDGNISNTTACECKATADFPCGPDSDCLNRLLLTECNPEVCPAGSKCTNQQFEKRLYPPLVPYKTESKGWGLKCLEPLHKGQFVIEYVGEMIEEQEYQRRIRKMNEQKNDNYYFLIIDKDRILDAGPKGNFSRFMNHSCQPNCETQKWTVNGDTRVGLFALRNVDANEELTFNYNLEYVGKAKKECKCGAPNCKGYIGAKERHNEKYKKMKRKGLKKNLLIPQVPIVNKNPCFICGKQGVVASCSNKNCNKYYHLECVNMEVWPEGRWICPWHNCNICTKRTIRCCNMCINSYCPSHADGNVLYYRRLGFLCSSHDPTKADDTANVATQEEVISSTTDDGDASIKSNRKTFDKDVRMGKDRINGDVLNERRGTTSNVNQIDNNVMINNNNKKKGRPSKRLANVEEPKSNNSKSRSKLRNSKNQSDRELANDINR